MRKAFQQKGFTRLFAGLTTSMFGGGVVAVVGGLTASRGPCAAGCFDRIYH